MFEIYMLFIFTVMLFTGIGLLIYASATYAGVIIVLLVAFGVPLLHRRYPRQVNAAFWAMVSASAWLLCALCTLSALDTPEPLLAAVPLAIVGYKTLNIARGKYTRHPTH